MTNRVDAPAVLIAGSVQSDTVQTQAVLVAQAETPPEMASAPVGQAAGSTVEIENGAILRLPDGVSIDAPRMNGSDLEFVQPDGSVITIPNGAIEGLTIFIGAVEIPPLTVAALFEASEIQTAAGPESGNTASSGGNFEVPVGGIGDALEFGELLGDSLFDGPGGTAAQQENDANLPPVFLQDLYEIRLSEEGLASGNSDQDGDLDSTDATTFTGMFSVSDVDPVTFTFGVPDNAMTSAGLPVTWSGNGTTTLTGQAGGVTVLVATINNATGEFTVTLLKALDHSGAGEDNLSFDFPVAVSDGRGGTASASIRVTIEDDSPVAAAPNSVQVDEGNLPGGNTDTGNDGDLVGGSHTSTGALNLNFGSDGPHATAAVVLSAQGATWTQGTATTGVLLADNGAWQIVVKADGTYTITLLDGHDHLDLSGEDDLVVDVTLTTRDIDGDVATAAFAVTIDDDSPVLGSVDTQNVAESTLATLANTFVAATLNDVPLNVNWGADGIGKIEFTTVAGVAGLTSNGEAITYALSAEGTVLTASAGGRTIFEVTLDPSTNDGKGGYTFALRDNIDHRSGSNEQKLTFGFKATDGDGDSIDGSLGVNIQDDVPAVGSSETGTVSEDDVFSLFGNLVPDSSKGTLAIDWNADENNDGSANRNLAFAPGFVAPAGLTSNGAAVTYSIDEVGKSLTASANGITVFTVTLSDSGAGNYTFRLFGNLDHAVGSDQLRLDFGVVATDADGDLASSSFAVEIDDGTLRIGGTGTGYVEEEALVGGNNDVAPVGVEVVGGLINLSLGKIGIDDKIGGTLRIDWGNDDANSIVNGGYGAMQAMGDRSVVFGDSPVASDVPLTSNGQSLSYVTSANGTILTALGSNGLPVFRVTLSDTGNGAYTFELLGQLDHPITASGAHKEDLLSLKFNFVARDGDGDSANGAFIVKVIDDAPTAAGNAIVALDDDRVAAGATDLVVTGVLAHDYGADGAGAVSWLGTGMKLGNNGLWYEHTSATELVITQMQGGVYVQVARLTITDQSSGAYTVEQLRPVVHPSGGGENNIQFTVSYEVSDGDGDTAVGTITIDIDDDVPSVATNDIIYVDDDSLTVGATPLINEGTLAHDFGADGGTVSWMSSGMTLGNNGLWYQHTSATELVITQMQDGVYVQVAKLTITDQSSGAYTVQQLRPIVHPNAGGENNIRFTVSYEVRDGDGDTAIGTVTIDIDDAVASVAANDVVYLDDDSLAVGASPLTYAGTLAHDFGADGGTASWMSSGMTLGNNGLWYQHTSATELVITQMQDGVYVQVAKLTITDQSSGAYTVEQLRPIVHPDAAGENNIQFTVSYEVRDADGDTAIGTITVDMDDDVPTVRGGHGLRYITVSEGNGATDAASWDYFAGVNPSINFGADGFGNSSFTGAIKLDIGGTLAGNVSLNLSTGPASSDNFTSHGEPITFRLDGEDRIEGFVLNANGDKVLVLELKLADGKVTTTLYQPVDHLGPDGAKLDGIKLDASLVFTDRDGDAVHSTIRTTIEDDVPTLRSGHGLRYITVSEGDGAATASWDYSAGVNPSIDFSTDGFGNSAFTGAIKLDIGGTMAGNVSLDLLSGPVSSDKFTSGGDPVVFRLDGEDRVEGYILTGTGDKILVLELTLVGGRVTTILHQAIDHIAPDGTKLGHIKLDAGVLFTDGDGDSVHSTIRTTIEDDVPTTSQADRYITLSETDLFGGVAIGTRNFAVDFGNDGYGQTFFTGAMSINIGGTLEGNVTFNVDSGPVEIGKLTSDGRAITFEKVDLNTIRGFIYSASGQRNDVIELKLSDAGTDITVTLLRPIDHRDVGSNNPLSALRLDATVGFADADGDVVTSILRVNINDAAPSLTAPSESGILAESDLPYVGVTSGDLGVTLGADKSSHVVFAPDAKTILEGLNLTSNGISLQFQIRDNGFGGQDLVAFKTGATPDEPVFIVGVYKPASFVGTLYQNLDHASGSDMLALNLVARVYDRDGDFVDSAFTITIDDDAPGLNGTPVDYNLLTNGDFSQGAWSPTSYGGSATDSVGWAISGVASGQAGVQLEQVEDDYLGMSSSTNGNMVDLAASPGNIEISQTLTGLNPSSSYTLRFEIGSPDPASADLEIYWNGAKLNAVFTITDQMALVTVEGLQPDTAGRGVLSFKEIGSPDNSGTYLANVSLAPATTADLPVVVGTMDENGSALFDLVEGAHFQYGADGAGSVSFNADRAVISAPSGTVLGKPVISYDATTGKLAVNPGSGFNGLSKGEIATLTIPFSIVDADGDMRNGLYRITITGSDDPISSSMGFPETGALTEYAEDHPHANSTTTRTEFDAPQGHAGHQGGGFYIYDDQGDSHTIQVVPGSVAGYLGEINAVVSETTAGDGTGFVTWKYLVSDRELNYLAQGETKIETFQIVVADQHGNTTSREIAVTLKGTNDKPVISVREGDVVVQELEETNSALRAEGTLTVTDVDVVDVVTATVGKIVISGPDYGTNLDHEIIRSFLTVNTTPVIGSGETSGSLTWKFNSGSHAFDFLASGTRLVFEYTIVVTDSAGATVEQVVTVAVNGTNDVPAISIPSGESPIVLDGVEVVSRSIAETNAALTAHGVLTVADADNLSAVSARVITVSGGGAGYSASDAWNFLTVSSASITDAGETSGNLSWTFNSGNEAFDFLPHGHQIRLNYTIEVTDQWGGTSNQLVTLLITGTNDEAEITGATTGQVSEDVTMVTAGRLYADDIDNTDDLFTAASGNASYGNWSINSSGEWSYTLNGANTDVDALNDGQILTDSFTVSSVDGTTKTVTVTIVGTSDAPVLPPPVPVGETITTNIGVGQAVTIPVETLLLNDGIRSGSGFTIISVTGATLAGGLITIASPEVSQAFTYVLGDGVHTLTPVTVTLIRSDGPLTGTNDSDFYISRNWGNTDEGGNDDDILVTTGNTISGGNGKDFMVGLGGNNTLNGGNNDDILIGASSGASNYLNGGNGDDVLRPGVTNGQSYLDGENGTDLIDFSSLTTGLNFTLSQSSSQTSFQHPEPSHTTHYKNMEGVIGTGFNDQLTGSTKADVLAGGGGNDMLTGGNGDDILSGDAGDDILWGGQGKDVLTGGFGADTFAFKEAGAANVDKITDYVFGEDVVDLSDLLAGITSENVRDNVRAINETDGARLQVQQSGEWVDVAVFDNVVVSDTTDDIRLQIDQNHYNI